MSNADVLKSLKAGDVIKITRTVKVDMADMGGVHRWALDVATNTSYLLDDSPTLKIEMVKKVAKQRTDYKVGDVVSGDELRATMWKRGTIISHKDWQQTRYVLMPSGTWAHAEEAFDERETTRYGFERFTAPGYTIKYLP